MMMVIRVIRVIIIEAPSDKRMLGIGVEKSGQ